MKAEDARDLNTRERRFVEAYCGDAGFVIAEAARQAGYADSTAHKIAPLWIGKNRESRHYKPHVARAIEERLDAMSMSAAEATKRMTDWGRGSFGPFMRINGLGEPVIDLSTEQAQRHVHLISEIAEEVYTEGRDEDAQEVKRIKIKLHDAKDATKNIMKARGLFGAKGTEEDPVHTKMVNVIFESETPEPDDG